MHAWLGRMPWALGWFFFVATISAAPPPADQLQVWIRQLDADDFATRERAGRNLAAAGEGAIAALAEGIASSSPEAAWRASSILEQIALSGNDAAVHRVAASLEQLSRSGKPGLTGVIKELYVKQARLRHDRALAKIRSLGGKFDGNDSDEAAGEAIEPAIPKLHAGLEGEEPAGLGALDVALKRLEGLLGEPGADSDPPPPTEPSAPPDLPVADAPLAAPPAPDPPPDLPPEEATPPAEGPLPVIGEAFIADAFVAPGMEEPGDVEEAEESLTIDKSWRGGDAGLAALRDLPGITSLSVHHASLTDAALDHIATLPRLQQLDIQSTPFTREALSKFRERRPETRIFARGDAMLGVNAEMQGPCLLTGVYDGSGASLAGLKAGDEILSVAGRKVRDFSDLTIAIAAHKPGEKVRVEFNRDGQHRSVEVLLQQRKLVEAANR